MRKTIKWAILIIVVWLGLILATHFPRPLLIHFCHSCFGLVGYRDFYTDLPISGERRDEIVEMIQAARRRVRQIYPDASVDPDLIICQTLECDRRAGIEGNKGRTSWESVVFIAHNSIEIINLSHELAHVAFEESYGSTGIRTGQIPAWFNEGLAVIVSGDLQMIPKSEIQEEICRQLAILDLPVSLSDWMTQARTDHKLYMKATCRVWNMLGSNVAKSKIDAAVASFAAR